MSLVLRVLAVALALVTGAIASGTPATRGALVVIVLGAAVTLAAVTARAADLTVVQRGKAFSTPGLSIKVGDTVTFMKTDQVTHNVGGPVVFAQPRRGPG